MRSKSFGLLAGAAVCIAGTTSRADVILNDLNSLLRLSQDMSGRVTGVSDWIVDGVDQAASQWFWFRTGSDAQEQVLHSLDQTITNQMDNMLMLSHTRPGLQIDVTYMLIGGSSGSTFSDIAESIRIRNTGTSTMQMSFYQHSDMNLNGSAQDAAVSLVNPILWRQTDFGPGLAQHESTSNPAPNLFEAGLAPSTLSRLNDLDIDNLGNSASAGPGDLTYSSQWNASIAPGGSFLIGIDDQIQPIPEPGTLMLLAVGGAALLRRRGRRPS